jgi:D-alanyl-D-alanine dipeptidase
MNFYDRDEKLPPKEPGIGRLNRIPILECGEAMICLDNLSPRLQVKLAPIPWVRETVAEMLLAAAMSLPENLALVVFTGFRSLAMQARSYRLFRASLRREHPSWPEAILRRETNRFFHPPDVAAPPGHSTGGAVDAKLAYLNGRVLDSFSTTRPEEKSWATFYPYLTPRARENRAVLYEAMLSAGFSNCPEEWWHYSFGDSGWAARLGEPYAIYGAVIDIPPALVKAIQKGESLPSRPLPE